MKIVLFGTLWHYDNAGIKEGRDLLWGDPGGSLSPLRVLGGETSFLSPGLSLHLPCTLSASLGQEGTADILNIGHDFVLIWKFIGF